MADIDVLENEGFTRVVATVDGQNVFDFDFLAYTADTLQVTFRPDTLLEAPLVLGVDFSVAGLGQEGGGSITLIGAYAGTADDGDEVLIVRSTPIKRLFDYQNAGDFRAEVVNRELDTMIMIDQETRREVNRAPKVPLGESPFLIERGPDNTVPMWGPDGLGIGPTADQISSAQADALAAHEDRLLAEEAAALAQAAVPNVFAATRTVLKAIDTNNITNAYLKELGREGQFLWKSGDFSAEIALDISEGIYVKADAVAGNAGAWVREHSNKYFARWFGAKEDGVTNDALAIQRAVSLCLSGARPVPLVLTGMCMINSPVIIDRAVGTSAGADTFTIIALGKFSGFTSALAGAIIDSNLPYIGAFNDTPACNIRFENVTFLGAGNPETTCVSDKFLKVHFEACRFNVIKCVVATYYLQSWRWHYCSMIAWPSWFCSNVGPYYDCHWDECDFESGADGIKSFESGFVGSSITKCLFENSGRFFAQSLGFGTTIIGNYTEANSAPDYQLSDPVNYGPHRGTVFTGNFMGVHSHGLHNVIVGEPQGMLAGGNYTDTRLYDTTNTPPGSFKSHGDFATISKFSALGSFDADHAGDYIEGVLSSVTPSGLVTGTAKTIASIALPPGDWDVSGLVGYTPAGTTSASRYSSSISLVNNAVGAEGNANINVFAPFVSGGFSVNYPTPVVRLSLAVTTTIYLVGLADFTVSTMTAFGRIRARKAGGR